MRQELTVDQIKKRAVSAFFSLTFRRLALQAITFASINLILARIYPPETGILGIFNLGTAVIAAISYFSDIGLAAALIQKKEKVTQEDLRTTFTIQEILIGFLTLMVFFAAPQVSKFYHFDQSGVWLVRALGLAFLVSSFKVIPSVLLERNLNFNPLVAIEIFETLVFNIILLTLAFMGKGLWSFSIAAIVRSVTGSITLFIIAPWKIRFGLTTDSARQLLSFGIPFQTNSFLALIKDRLVPIFVAKIVGPVGLSLVTWSQALAFLPLEALNIVVRITFPAYSRLQEKPAELKTAIEKSLFATVSLVYPALFGLLAVAPAIVTHLVSVKWQPALSSLYLFTVATFFAAISTTFTNALAAIGKIKIVLQIMVFWTILTWILVPVAVFSLGFLGVSAAIAGVSATSFLPIVAIKKFVDVEIIKTIWKPLVASVIMSGIVYLISQNLVSNILSLALVVILGVVFYGILIFLLAKEEVLTGIKEVLRQPK